MNFLATVPFDLYQLHLFRLVVRHASFTRAATEAGLTQSAITRQIQGMESALDLPLLERTTRRVRPTPAGEFLFREAARLTGDVDRTLQRLREEFADARKEVRVGVSRSVGLAYLPGFFHANLRKLPQVGCRVSYRESARLLEGLEANELDLAIFCPPRRLPRTLRITHRFDDAFTLIAPREAAVAWRAAGRKRRDREAWIQSQNWLSIDRETSTGAQLHRWMQRCGWKVEPVMQLDSFDLIISLVALGMGVSFVPIRALALYGRKKQLQRLDPGERFVRKVVVAMREQRTVPAHLAEFVANVLF